MTVATAPGKVILFGEHAVVYGRPAIAVPVWETVATATITDLATGAGCTVYAHDLDRNFRLADGAVDDPLALIVRLTLAELGLSPDPNWRIALTSQVPMTGGLGSGAAAATAIVRAIYAHTGLDVSPETAGRLVFESERLYHGTPSGIDNSVIAYGTPIWFVRGSAPRPLQLGKSFTIAIADSGVSSPTVMTVGDVRRAWQADPERYEGLFDAIAEIARQARYTLETGNVADLGPLFNQNQTLLASLQVSSPILETLIEAARVAGAGGAKLSGGGRGGNIVALVSPGRANAIRDSLLQAGARSVLLTTVP